MIARSTATDWRETVKNYVKLTKPTIVGLLLFTTVIPMFLAREGPYDASFWALVFWTLVGGALAAGGAGAINMYLDRDIDARMSRTRQRPIPSNRIQPIHALSFGIVLNLIAFVVLVLTANLLAAVLAMIGTFYYTVVYTSWLKRRTTQNIVIGGAAGAIPPLVGWAAVAGHLSAEPLLLFAIIYYWTPPHFWALALLRQVEYARAGIPMLPVVAGEQATKWQILLYTVLLVAITALLTPLGMAGPLYLVLALALGAIFIRGAYRLYRQPGVSAAWPLYKYSSMYLALVFAAMLIDHLIMRWW
ncbi:heme o synthase [Kallotenue papyrolyticum]|uniref:heme o synthase n=1 Tax=Kallotenue papyrolyticum TaxID=1325125 RepID=UPI0004B4C888|nr:heme o synthase [Kallotenue papyrolyticum]